MKLHGIVLFAVLVLSSFGVIAANDSGRPLNASSGSEKSIMDVLRADGNFKTLVGALESTGLSRDLETKGPYTLFAPNDHAFETVADLQKFLHDSTSLKVILQYHLVPISRMESKDLVALNSVISVQGSDLHFRLDHGVLRVNEAVIVKPDLHASNGVIHGIDRLLTPPATIEERDQPVVEQNRESVKDHAEYAYGVLKDGAYKAKDGLTTGFRKIKETFVGSKDVSTGVERTQ